MSWSQARINLFPDRFFEDETAVLPFITVQQASGNHEVFLKRNTLIFIIKGQATHQASLLAQEVADSLIRLLSLHFGHLIYQDHNPLDVKTLSVEEKQLIERDLRQLPQYKSKLAVLSRATLWHLDRVARQALTQFSGALWGLEHPMRDRNEHIFLDFFKAMELVLGNSKDHRKLRSKAVLIGLTNAFIKDEFLPLQAQRDAHAAHASLRTIPIDENSIDRVRRVSRKVLISYFNSLPTVYPQ